MRLTKIEREMVASGLDEKARAARAGGEPHLAEQMERAAKVVRDVGNKTPTMKDVRVVKMADVALQAWTLVEGGRR